MSDNDERDGLLLPFPRVIMPAFPGTHEADEPRPDGGEPASAGAWPRLPEVAEMRPPLHLTVPGVSTPEPADEEGALALPAPADPDNPTAREVAAVAMALVTAMGVAAAQGMWHRARRRQALADQARATADRAIGKAAAGPQGGRTAGASKGTSGSSALRSLGSTSPSKKPRRSADDRKGHDKQTRKSPSRPPSSPKADRRGKNTRDRDKPKQRKDRRGKGGTAWWRRRPGGTSPKSKTPKAPKSRPEKNKPNSEKPGTPPARTLRWKASKDDKDAKGPKRWARGRADGPTPKKPKDDPGKKAKKSASGPKRSGGTWARRLTWRAPKSGPGKNAKGPRASGGPGKGSGTGAKRPGSAGRSKRRWRGDRRTGTAGTTGGWNWTDYDPWAGGENTPPPPPGFGGMRPPPAADRTTRITVERVDERPRTEPAALTVGRAALSARPSAARPAPPATSHQQGARFVSTPARTTQYRDAELTIHDVIDADADMAEEITDGVSEAQATAQGCERLMTKLEAVHAEIIALKVPGVLASMLLLLMEKTASVKAKAEAIAETLPTAAEAISTAGTNASARHKPLADAVRDAGHIRPAERDYHNE